MELAADAGSRAQFEQYKQQMMHQALPVRLRVEFELHVGRGYQMFGDFDAARPWLEQALRGAEAHSLNVLVFQIEAALDDNEHCRCVLARTRPCAVPSVRDRKHRRWTQDDARAFRFMRRMTSGTAASCT